MQWSKRYSSSPELRAIPFIMVSIGVPEKASLLIDHLELSRYGTDTKLFVDPDNAVYDALDLNRGIQRTFFSPSTPFAFLDRLTEPGGLQELGGVLAKWNKGVLYTMVPFSLVNCLATVSQCRVIPIAFYIPPKNTQTLLQGGTFVFDGPKTLYAHYDPSTAAHASIDRVLEIANSAIAARQESR
jgi:AhpC/TSA antioxidant enzyme